LPGAPAAYFAAFAAQASWEQLGVELSSGALKGDAQLAFHTGQNSALALHVLQSSEFGPRCVDERAVDTEIDRTTSARGVADDEQE
jgi:hypothetical protein